MGLNGFAFSADDEDHHALMMPLPYVERTVNFVVSGGNQEGYGGFSNRTTSAWRCWPWGKLRLVGKVRGI